MNKRNGSGDLPPGDRPSPVAESVAQVVELGKREVERIALSERLAHRVTAFSGSMVYVWLHVAWFAIWTVVNTSWFGLRPFDAFPFGFLTMIVSLEAIFLSTFVLMAQNRQDKESEKRAKIDLQVNMIAEQEITKIIKMLAALQDHLGIKDAVDAELVAMQASTRIDELADANEAAEAKI